MGGSTLEARKPATARPSRCPQRERSRLLQRSHLVTASPPSARAKPLPEQGLTALQQLAELPAGRGSPPEPGGEDLAQQVLDAATAWQLCSEDDASATHKPGSRGLVLISDTKDRFYGGMTGAQVEQELVRVATLLHGLLRDFSVLKDSVGHLEDDRNHWQERHELMETEHGRLQHVCEEVQNKVEAFDTKVASAEEHCAEARKASDAAMASNEVLQGRCEVFEARLITFEDSVEALEKARLATASQLESHWEAIDLQRISQDAAAIDAKATASQLEDLQQKVLDATDAQQAAEERLNELIQEFEEVARITAREAMHELQEGPLENLWVFSEESRDQIDTIRGKVTLIGNRQAASESQNGAVQSLVHQAMEALQNAEAKMAGHLEQFATKTRASFADVGARVEELEVISSALVDRQNQAQERPDSRPVSPSVYEDSRLSSPEPQWLPKEAMSSYATMLQRPDTGSSTRAETLASGALSYAAAKARPASAPAAALSPGAYAREQPAAPPVVAPAATAKPKRPSSAHHATRRAPERHLLTARSNSLPTQGEAVPLELLPLERLSSPEAPGPEQQGSGWPPERPADSAESSPLPASEARLVCSEQKEPERESRSHAEAAASRLLFDIFRRLPGLAWVPKVEDYDEAIAAPASISDAEMSDVASPGSSPKAARDSMDSDLAPSSNALPGEDLMAVLMGSDFAPSSVPSQDEDGTSGDFAPSLSPLIRESFSSAGRQSSPEESSSATSDDGCDSQVSFGSQSAGVSRADDWRSQPGVSEEFAPSSSFDSCDASLPAFGQTASDTEQATAPFFGQSSQQRPWSPGRLYAGSRIQIQEQHDPLDSLAQDSVGWLITDEREETETDGQD
eukprot:TRINITY_DN50401_c0_g1_i1.p1 TRINITY_DN50401_c0_g1~~TRINITY_DN50401_c0_g1_i1.p1  ORF type:complete len:891 (+),score=210.55 TRINITY_DN50401_c0_g1_i1:93-2675(+)